MVSLCYTYPYAMNRECSDDNDFLLEKLVLMDRRLRILDSIVDPKKMCKDEKATRTAQIYPRGSKDRAGQIKSMVNKGDIISSRSTFYDHLKKFEEKQAVC